MAAADGAPGTRIDVAGVVPSECSVARVGWSVLLSGSCDRGPVPEAGLRVKAKVAAATPRMIGTHTSQRCKVSASVHSLDGCQESDDTERDS